MQVVYKAHEINVTKEKCLAGYTMLYWSIFRISDGFECDSGCMDSDDTVRTIVKVFKGRIDAELKEEDPWMEKAHE